MKTYNITNRMSKEARKEIENTIETNEKYAHSYFFHPGVTASQRRANEEVFNRQNQPYTLINGRDTIVVSYNYSESCKNVYYSLSVMVNKEKKDIRVLKKLLV